MMDTGNFTLTTDLNGAGKKAIAATAARISGIFAVAALVYFASPAMAAWKLHEEVDELTDVESVLAVTGHGRKWLGILCVDGSVEVKIHMENYLNSKFDPVQVNYRIDKGKVISQTWKAYRGNMAYTSGTEAIRFARALSSGRKLIFRAKDYRGYDHTHSFDLSGSEAPIRKTLLACGE